MDLTSDADVLGTRGNVGVSSEGDSHIFTARQEGLEHLGLNPGQPARISGVAASNSTVLAAVQAGEIVRWDQCEGATVPIDFGRDRCTDVARVLLEPKGFHAIITSRMGDSWYLNFQSNQAKPLPKLKEHQIETVAWDPDSTPASTRDLIVGTERGQLLHVVINDGKEKLVRPLYAFELGGSGRQPNAAAIHQPVCGVHRERVQCKADMAERILVLAAAGCGLYAFMGPSLEGLTPRETSKALVYEVPRDSPHGDLLVDSACVGDAFAKNIFWLTGVGVLSCTIKNPVEADNAVLEGPPSIIPFPPSPKEIVKHNHGGSLVSSLLPPEPPPAPLAMALARYHIIFLFNDRWAAVSRINHDLVQQQEWAKTTHGLPRGLSRDLHGERLWMYSDKQLFEIVAEREDRSIWLLLLRMERFDEALKACTLPAQRTRVLAAHADWLFRTGKFVEAAKKFAEDTAVPFEHVALRFLRVDHKPALLEYLRCRLRRCQKDDRVTRALLGVWAVEMSLAHLNDMRLAAHGSKARAALDVERGKLKELLRDCKDLDVHEPLYHLLQSHGWLDELAYFAEARRDFNTVIVHHVSRRDCVSAINKLADFQADGAGEDLVCRFAPVLFGAEPRAFVSLLLRPQLEKVDPLSVLPAVYLPRAPPSHRAEALRYLKHVVQNHPELIGQGGEAAAGGGESAPSVPSIRTGSLLPDNDFVTGAVEDFLGGGGAAPGCGSWASGTAVLNASVVLFACDCVDAKAKEQAAASAASRAAESPPEAAVAIAVGAEDQLIEFLTEQQSNTLLDPRFALRVCTEKGLSRAAVLLYGIMGMHEEAVDVALQQGDVGLAKQNACKPPDARLRQKLWLRIVENQVASGDVQIITGLIRESQELSVRDVLPYMSDAMTISAFQAEICECLDKYENQIETMRQEMDDHQRALEAFKEDLKEAEERTVTIEQDQPCEICGIPAMQELHGLTRRQGCRNSCCGHGALLCLRVHALLPRGLLAGVDPPDSEPGEQRPIAGTRGDTSGASGGGRGQSRCIAAGEDIGGGRRRFGWNSGRRLPPLRAPDDTDHHEALHRRPRAGGDRFLGPQLALGALS
mmetsp:Transcript_107503/g.342740  ORF Transcript_107503/g.342740 Transcript_107503/m.342740 type:complete len:1086 (+) Transcript_107503:55-3312(+)